MLCCSTLGSRQGLILHAQLLLGSLILRAQLPHPSCYPALVESPFQGVKGIHRRLPPRPFHSHALASRLLLPASTASHASTQDVGLMEDRLKRGPGLFPLARHVMGEARYAEVRSAPAALETEWHFRRRVQVRERRAPCVPCTSRTSSSLAGAQEDLGSGSLFTALVPFTPRLSVSV